MHFPIPFEQFRGFPINNHPGAFGYRRKYDIHTGIDLYCEEGTSVYAIETGQVVAYKVFTGKLVKMPWWRQTYALLVRSKNRYILYGEMKRDRRIRCGDIVDCGQFLGEAIPVLYKKKIRKDIPGHSHCMLHLEQYSLDYSPDMGWIEWTDKKPDFLIDPTPLLFQFHIFMNDSRPKFL